MCCAPQQLPNGLRVACDSNDASLPEVQFWFIDCSDFKDVEGGGIEEVEGEEGGGPDSFVHSRKTTEKNRKERKKMMKR